MDYTKISSDLPRTTVTNDLNKLSEQTGNIYESIAVISAYANVVAREIKDEYDAKVREQVPNIDTVDGPGDHLDALNHLAEHYEQKLPKPSLIATSEFLKEHLYWRLRTKGDNASSFIEEVESALDKQHQL